MSVTLIPMEIQPDTTVSMALFRDVDNAKEVRQAVMKGTFEAALLNPCLIVDPFQVTVAANRALHLQQLNKMMTKTIHSEILFCLSPRKNISNAFKTFGMGDKDTSVFVAIVNDQAETTLSTIKSIIKGQQVEPERVSEFTDTEAVKKVYSISELELTASSLQEAIVSRIASKEFVQV